MTPVRGPLASSRIAWTAIATGLMIGWTWMVHARPQPFFALASAFCAGWLGISVLALRHPERRRFQVHAAGLAWAVAVALVLYLGARGVLWTFCGGVSQALCQPLERVYARFGTGDPWAGLALALVIAPAEELFWRGVVQAALRRRFGPIPTAAIASLLSAVVLLAASEPLLALAALPTSFAWGVLAEKRRSLVPAMVSHALWDVLIVVLIPAT